MRPILSEDGQTLTIRVPLTIRQRVGYKKVVTPDGAAWAPPPRIDNAMVKALARAFRWRKQIDEGVYGSLEDLARGKSIAPSYVSLGRNIERIGKVMPCDAYMVPRSEQHKEVGSDLYHGGVAMPGYCGIHPAKYAKGLAEAAKRLGVSVFGNARVTDLQQRAGGFAYKVQGRDVTARQVLIATNGYSGGLLPYLRRRVIPVGSGLVTTEKLPPELMKKLMPKQQMLAGSQRVVTYYRPSPDGTRVILGGRVLDMSGTEKSNTANAAYLRGLLLKIFPELSAYKISHYWHGQLGFTFDHFPHVDTIDGMFFAGGYNGTGVARASWLGSRIANQMLGNDQGKTVYSELSFESRPYFNGKPWFLPLAVWYYGMLDKWDQR